MNTNLRPVLMAALMTMAAACNFMPGGAKPPAEKANDAVYGVPVKVEEGATHERDLGDIEASIKINAVLAGKSAAANVKADSLINERQELNMTTITVTPPAPAELWVTAVVRCRTGFGDTPVLLRAKVMRDKQEIDSFAFILGADASAATHEYSVNALKDLPAAPETSLLHVQAEFLMFPNGTDPAAIDPATATLPEERIGHMMSNPVRINYTPGAPAQ